MARMVYLHFYSSTQFRMRGRIMDLNGYVTPNDSVRGRVGGVGVCGGGPVSPGGFASVLKGGRALF